MRNRYTVLFALVATLLGACAPVPPQPENFLPGSVPNLLAETDDLGMVADEALQLADRLGNDRVLVVFDIDNTLLTMKQGLGSDPWYYWQKQLAEDDPCSPLLAGDRMPVQGALFFAGAMRPTQPDMAQQVARLQEAGLRVIALTSRGPEYRLQTFRELRRNGIAFWPSALPPQHGWDQEFVPAGGSRPARYEDGVFLTAGQHKGAMLQALLERTGTPAPAAVVMADDKESYLRDVMGTFAGSATAVHGWRFSREDGAVAAFDPAAAATQWETVRPALEQIEAVFGPDNYHLPVATTKNCDRD